MEILKWNKEKQIWETPQSDDKLKADYISTDFSSGIVLTAPNSDRYLITIDNAGNLVQTLITPL